MPGRPRVCLQPPARAVGGGLTPWHADQYYWPVSTDNTCTAWVPLQPTPLEMGPLAFSAGSHRYNVGRKTKQRLTSAKSVFITAGRFTAPARTAPPRRAA
jgi:ectoine hydroxylase-related dioxygenase (phytanoyl-CoA dioxygenase family)